MIGGSWSSRNELFARLKFYVWTSGAPGFTLTVSGECQVGQQQQLAVKAVTNLRAWNAGIRPGDILLAVSGTSVRSKTAEQAMVMVATTETPAVLRFAVSKRHRSLYSVERFDVTLGHQKLGVMFTGDGAEMVPVVNGIMRRHHHPATRFESRLSNSAAIRLGDVLVAVNGMDAVSIGLERAMALIASTKVRPMKLTFQRLANDIATNLRSTDVANAVMCSRNTTTSRQLRSSWASGSTDQMVASRLTVSRGFGQYQPKEDLDLTFAHRSTSDACADENNDDGILIVWKDGPLGLTLCEDDISGLPLVNRLTGKGRSTGLHHVQHGFLLTSVNGITTAEETFAQVCERLSSMEKPVVLLFHPPSARGFADRESFTFSASSQSSTSSREMEKTTTRLGDVDKHLEYEVVWNAFEKLGLVLGTPQLHAFPRSSSSASSPAILRVQPTCLLGFEADPVGDVLMSVNNRSTDGLRWEQVRLLLDYAAKPAVLRFRRCKLENTCHEYRQTESLSSLDSLSMRSSTGSEQEESEFASDADDDDDDDGDSLSSRIERPSSAPFSSSYNLLWSEGSLGIAFDTYEDSDKDGALVIYVKRLLLGGHAKRTRLVSVGDRLVHLNRKRIEATNDARFRETMRQLETMSKPVVLGFQRPMVEVGEPSLCGES